MELQFHYMKVNLNGIKNKTKVKTHKNIKKYPVKPEIVILAGTDTQIDKFRIPEVKIRFNKGRLFDYGKITSSKDADVIFRKINGNMIQTQEMGTFLYLNRANKVLGYYKHTIGGTAGTIFDIKLIMSGAVKCLAHGIIASHNHPSGNLLPSDADKRLTKQLKAAAEVHDINLLDHIIVCKHGYTSFGDEGLLGLNGLNETKTTNKMITKNNYFEEIKKYNLSDLPEAIQQNHEFMVENREFIGQDKEIDEFVDFYLQILNQYPLPETKAQKPEKVKKEKAPRVKKMKPVKPPRVKKEKLVKPPRVKKEKPVKVPKVDNSNKVAHFDDDMKIIRRFKTMLGKTKAVKLVLNLYKAIEKAITEERITKKNSTFHAMITEIQENLNKGLKQAKENNLSKIKFEIGKGSERIMEICKLEKIYDSVKLIKRYISLQGNETKEKAKTLLNLVCKALLKFPEIKYGMELEQIKVQLGNYINGKDFEINPPVELHGLFGRHNSKKKR